MNYRLIHADVLEGLRSLADESVQVCVTSPPYWGLRDYGVAGQLGLERTPDEYVARMVEVFREVRRGLRSDGTLWLNVGDSYVAAPKGPGGDDKSTLTPSGVRHQRIKDPNTKQAKNASADFSAPHRRRAFAGLKSKDLVGVPWMLAFALRADGWYLRSDIIWSKPNPMPESVTDRPTKAHEYMFLLSKSARYFYDAEAIKEQAVTGDPRKPYAPGQVDGRGNGHDRNGGKVRESVKRGGFDGKTNALEGREAFRAIEEWRNKRSVWHIPTEPFPEAHFATFPTALVDPCILAGSRVGDTVLDPFNGSGTTGVVALSHQRNYVGIDLNVDYIAMARRRLSTVAPMFATEIA